MQTAGHVAGAAHYYTNNYNPKALGVSIHPIYGGWFAFRSVIIFPSIIVNELEQVIPLDVVPEEAQRVELLKSFTEDWRTFAYRDIIPSKAKYSERQIKYFATTPGERFALLEHFMTDAGNTLSNSITSAIF